MIQDPRKHADVAEQVETIWCCLVTVIGVAVMLVAVGQGMIVVRGSETAMLASKVAAARERRIVKECKE